MRRKEKILGDYFINWRDYGTSYKYEKKQKDPRGNRSLEIHIKLGIEKSQSDSS